MNAPATNAMAAMGGIVGTLRDVAVSPVRRWSQATTMQKVLSIAAGVGTAYYLHREGFADAPVALGGLAAAWGLSAVMHYPAIVQAQPGAAPTANTTAALPAPVEQMAQQAEAVMGLGQYQAQATVPTSALAPAGGAPQAQPSAPMAPRAPAPPVAPAAGGSKWAILDQ